MGGAVASIIPSVVSTVGPLFQKIIGGLGGKGGIGGLISGLIGGAAGEVEKKAPGTSASLERKLESEHGGEQGLRDSLLVTIVHELKGLAGKIGELHNSDNLSASAIVRDLLPRVVRAGTHYVNKSLRQGGYNPYEDETEETRRTRRKYGRYDPGYDLDLD